MSTVANSFYMRELPKEHLIGYDTVEGKRLFKHALLEGGLESFFPLSQQFLTASSPEYMYLFLCIGAPRLIDVSPSSKTSLHVSSIYEPMFLNGLQVFF